MQGFPRVLFEVGPRDADFARGTVVQRERKASPPHDRLGELADLISLGQVGIKVILALEDRAAADLGADGETEHKRIAHGLLVEHGKHPGHGEIDGAGLRICRGAKGRGSAGKDLGLRGQLQVHFQADDRFPTHPARSAVGRRVCQSVRCWY